MDEGDRKCLDDIEKYGCHVLHILAEDDLFPFSYSVGIEKSAGQPEVIIIGLWKELAHSMINGYCERVRAGERFQPGQRVSGFLEGFDCEVHQVNPRHYREYVGWNLWLYKGEAFSLVQLVYPSTSGYWPWDEGSSDDFRRLQPVLDT